MALVRCPDCNKDVSDRADSCPNCGFPIFSYLENKRYEEELREEEEKAKRQILIKQEEYKQKHEFNLLGEIFKFDQNERLCTIIESVFYIHTNKIKDRLEYDKGHDIYDSLGNSTLEWGKTKVEEYYISTIDYILDWIGKALDDDDAKNNLGYYLEGCINLDTLANQFQEMSDEIFIDYELEESNAIRDYEKKVGNIGAPYRPINAVYSNSVSGLIGASIKAGVINGVTETVTGLAGESIKRRADKEYCERLNKVAKVCNKKRVAILEENVLDAIETYKNNVYNWLLKNNFLFEKKGFVIKENASDYCFEYEEERNFLRIGIEEASKRKKALQIIKNNPANYEMYGVILEGIKWDRRELISFVNMIRFFFPKSVNVQNGICIRPDGRKLFDGDTVSDQAVDNYLEYQRVAEFNNIQSEKIEQVRIRAEEKKRKSEEEKEFLGKLESKIESDSVDLVSNYRELFVFCGDPDTINKEAGNLLLRKYEDKFITNIKESTEWSDESKLESIFGTLIKLKSFAKGKKEWEDLLALYDLIKQNYQNSFFKKAIILKSQQTDNPKNIYSISAIQQHQENHVNLGAVGNLLEQDELMIFRIECFGGFLYVSTHSFYIKAENRPETLIHKFTYEDLSDMWLGIDKTCNVIKYSIKGNNGWNYSGEKDTDNYKFEELFARHLKKHVQNPEKIKIDYGYVDVEKRKIIEEIDSRKRCETTDVRKTKKPNVFVKPFIFICFVMVCILVGKIIWGLFNHSNHITELAEEKNATDLSLDDNIDANISDKDTGNEIEDLQHESFVDETESVITPKVTPSSVGYIENTEKYPEERVEENIERMDDTEIIDEEQTELTGIDNSYLSGRYREKVDENVSVMYVDMYDDFAEGHPCGTVRIEYEDSSIVTGDFIYTSTTGCFYSELYCDGKDLGNYYITFDLYCNPVMVRVFYANGPEVAVYELDE